MKTVSVGGDRTDRATQEFRREAGRPQNFRSVGTAWDKSAKYHRGTVSPEVAAEQQRVWMLANRWRLDAEKAGYEAFLRGDDAEAERLFREADLPMSRVWLGDLLVMQGRYAEALEVVAPRLDRGEDPKWVNPVIAVCYYGLGDRRKGDAAAPKVVVDCGAYYEEQPLVGPVKDYIDETPNKTPVDSSAKMEAAAWHAIGSNRQSGRFALHCTEKAALAFPDVPAFSISYAFALRSVETPEGGWHMSDSIDWYRRCLRTAKGSIRELVETTLEELERMRSDSRYSHRDTRRNP